MSRYDASTIEPFNGLIDEIFRRGCYRVCLDATRLERVSATGIGVLLAAAPATIRAFDREGRAIVPT